MITICIRFFFIILSIFPLLSFAQGMSSKYQTNLQKDAAIAVKKQLQINAKKRAEILQGQKNEQKKIANKKIRPSPQGVIKLDGPKKIKYSVVGTVFRIMMLHSTITSFNKRIVTERYKMCAGKGK